MSALNLSITGGTELVARLRTGANTVAEALRQEMATQMARAADWSRANKLSGDPLHRRSGQLSTSLTARAELDGGIVRGVLGSPLVYGRVHETGGTFNIPGHSRTSKAGKSFDVRAHTANYPQRAFLMPSLVANRELILDSLRAAALKVLE